MATNPSTLPENVGRITAPDADYPYGSAKDDSTGTTGDGTPIKKALLDDTYGFFQAALSQAGIVPSGNAETANVSQVLQGILQLAAAQQKGFINGLTTVIGADADHDIDIEAGSALDATDSVLISLTSQITKQIDATWAEGDSAGGFPSGLTLTADTWYHLFVIAKADGTVDAGWDTSLTAANLLSDATDYVYYRRIASNLTDSSSNITAYLQTGDYFEWDQPMLDLSIGNPGTAAVFQTMSAPPGVKSIAKISSSLEDNSAVGITYMTLVTTAQSSNLPSSAYYTVLVGASPTRAPSASVIADITTNTSSQIKYRLSQSTSDHVLRLFTYGWQDFRGKQ